MFLVLVLLGDAICHMEINIPGFEDGELVWGTCQALTPCCKVCPTTIFKHSPWSLEERKQC